MHRHVATVTITVSLTLSIIIPALILVPGEGAHKGLNGASFAWLCGNLFAAAVAVIVTWVSRRVDEQGNAEKELDPLVSVV